MARNKTILYSLIVAFTIVCPFVFPNFGTQLATLWLMIIVALTWDMTGGQMGYNSLGNIFFYGTGMYVAAVVAIGLVYDVVITPMRRVAVSTSLPISSISAVWHSACSPPGYSARLPRSL